MKTQTTHSAENNKADFVNIPSSKSPSFDPKINDDDDDDLDLPLDDDIVLDDFDDDDDDF